MSVRNQLKLIIGGLGGRRSERDAHDRSVFREFLDGSKPVAVAIFVVTVCAIVIISSVGMHLLDIPILPHQIATVGVVSSAPFSYVSQEKTRDEREQFLRRIPPVYRLDYTGLHTFEDATKDLLKKLAAFDQDHPADGVLLGRREALAALTEDFNARGPYELSTDDLATLLAAGDAPTRQDLMETGLSALREIYEEGIHDSSLGGQGPDSVTVFQIERPSGGVTLRPVQSMEDALTFLRVSLDDERLPRPVAVALFRYFRTGAAPNLVFDREETQRRADLLVHKLRPVTVTVARGQTIVEAGTRVTPEQYEMYAAHRKMQMESPQANLNEGLELFGRVLLVLAMVLASMLYIRMEDPETLRSNVRLGLLALVVIVNLALVRAVYSAGAADVFVSNPSWASTLPYLAPTALAPLIVAILIDAGSAIFMALLISIFTGVMYGNRIDLTVTTFLASLVAIFGCREARRRGRVVRAAGMGGLTVAAFAALVGFAEQTPIDTLFWQMGAGLVMGLVTGVSVVGLLPVLESLFKRTTDITLLELTDYNHPLLRRMQLDSPGTYHHSLVVAQLAENACNAIGANPLLARTCALFHDIGKAVNPAFFTENIRNRGNPHDEKSPAASAAIIKQHVSDGVDLAHRHRLPKAVIDVIRQHHGTTLVRFFYERARTLSAPPFPGDEPVAVPEAPYRYDGPKPQFKESAVISLADGVEAATRSMPSITADTLGEWIDQFLADRIHDGQLDEAPLTFEDLAKVRNSFTFTLLNMHHGRVAYPVPAGGTKTTRANA